MSYFAPSEFRCKCGRPDCDALATVTPMLLSKLDLLRYRLGRALVVTSGLRCAYWNEHEGGEKNSEHLTGEAADVVAPTSRERWAILAALFADKTPLVSRLGVGRDFVHIGVSTVLPAQVVWTYYPRTVS